MAIHQRLSGMAAEAIEEYLTAADSCIHYRKADGGMLGYPAVLLLFSVVEALSNYLECPRHSLKALRHLHFDPSLTDDQVKNLKDWYRNPLAHVGVIARCAMLSAEPDGKPFEFSPSGEPTRIRVIPFYRLVRKGWDAFDRTKLKPESQLNEQRVVNRQAPNRG